MLAQAEVAEQILHRVTPNWLTDFEPDGWTGKWSPHLEFAPRAIAKLERQEEIDNKLGDNTPKLRAAAMHDWAWEGARPLWQSGHFREAVAAASRKINAETQNKVKRKDVSEIDLFNQCWSLKLPEEGKPRLRVMTDDGSKTYTSIHRGIMSFAERCYAAMRNPASHLDGLDELPESQALEQLAAFSTLARWVDESTAHWASS